MNIELAGTRSGRDAFGPVSVDYLVGWIERMKRRNEDEFISMSEAAGVPGTSSQGLTLAGVRFTPCWSARRQAAARAAAKQRFWSAPSGC